MQNHQWLLEQRPVGMIRESDFRWNEINVPPLRDGEVLLRNVAFSYDPNPTWLDGDGHLYACGPTRSRNAHALREPGHRVKEQRFCCR